MGKIIKQAFTLIELLVVIAIIGILSGLIVVSMNGITQKATIAKAQVFSDSLKNSLMMNLVGQWTFDDIADYSSTTKVIGTTAGNIPDSWSSNEGTASGGPLLSIDCVSGNCLYLDGSNDYIDCGEAGDLNASNAITISFWFNSSSFSGLKGIISKMNYVSESDKQGYYIRFNGSGYLYFQTQNNSSTNGTVASSFALSLNRWYFVAVSFVSGNMKMYVNGDFNNQTTGQNSPAETTASFKIGSTYGTTENFNGYVDDIRVFNSAVPSSQIKENYYAGLNSLLASGSISNKEYRQRITETSLNK